MVTTMAGSMMTRTTIMIITATTTMATITRH
jgi:hypothetical protein